MTPLEHALLLLVNTLYKELEAAKENALNAHEEGDKIIISYKNQTIYTVKKQQS